MQERIGQNLLRVELESVRSLTVPNRTLGNVSLLCPFNKPPAVGRGSGALSPFPDPQGNHRLLVVAIITPRRLISGPHYRVPYSLIS